MKLRVDRITDESTESSFSVPPEELNQRLEHGATHDFRLTEPLAVDVRYYRAGEEIYFDGSCSAAMEGTCARCLESFTLPLAAPFEFVLTRAQALDGAQELHTDDLALSYYDGDEIDLGPLVGEQAILALPTRAVCREDCKGLCPSCGANLNDETCACKPAPADPRLAILANAKVRSAS
jgi:uncharacterized protein